MIAIRFMGDCFLNFGIQMQHLFEGLLSYLYACIGMRHNMIRRTAPPHAFVLKYWRQQYPMEYSPICIDVLSRTIVLIIRSIAPIVFLFNVYLVTLLTVQWKHYSSLRTFVKMNCYNIYWNSVFIEQSSMLLNIH